MGWLRTAGGLAGAGALAGTAATAYGTWEAHQFTLRRYDVPALPAGMKPLRILQLSDIHMLPQQRAKQDWLRSLAALEPDLVIDSGDNLAHRDSIAIVLDCLGPLLDRPGVFVHGSNDYFEPRFRNPLTYLLDDDGTRNTDVELPWRDLSRGMTDAGWIDLTNRRRRVTVGETMIAFAGVDDPHLDYDDLAAVAGPADADADVRLGVTHAPYLRVLDQFAAEGYDGIIAGHTHGGQICLPLGLRRPGRTLATNCDLEPARAKGMHRHPADSEPGQDGSSWLHVSAGVGTNPYVRLRIACRPEASLITLHPVDR